MCGLCLISTGIHIWPAVSFQLWNKQAQKQEIFRNMLKQNFQPFCLIQQSFLSLTLLFMSCWVYRWLNRRAGCHRWNGDTCLIIWLKFFLGQTQINKSILMLILVQLGLSVGRNEGISNQGAIAISTTDIHSLGIPIPKKVPAENLRTNVSIKSLIRPYKCNGMFFNRRSVAYGDRGLSAYVCQRLTHMTANKITKVNQ